jgi:hypothetical protein
LLANEAPDFRFLQDHWKSLRPLAQGSRHKFVVLGRFDQLILTVSDKAEELMPFGESIANARAATNSAHIGRVVAPGEGYDPDEWARTHPILGLCSVRFARRALAAAGSFEFLDGYLKGHLPQVLGVRHAIISATGWEDVLVLFHTRNFNSVARATGILRGMRIQDLPFHHQMKQGDGFNHPCLTTCTLPAYCCQWHPGWLPGDTAELLARLDADAPLHWAVRVELHPGHWKGFQKHMQGKCSALGLQVQCRPTFGQTDLRISDNSEETGTHRGLLTFLMEVIYPLGIEERAVIRSVETHLHPVLTEDDYMEDGTARALVDQTYSTRNHESAFPSEVQSRLIELAVPPHTLRVLEETLSRVQGMSHDPMHGEEFQTLERLQRAFTKSIRNLVVKDWAPAAEKEARALQIDISDWQMNLDRCLADRFRGAYPTGDSLMMRLGSYQGAHHRFLVIMDHLAQEAYDMARHAIQSLHAPCLLPQIALATFIGNSPSPYATSHTIDRLGCGFTDIPATLICRMRDTHLLAHETAHHIIRAFFCAVSGIGFTFYDTDAVGHGLDDKTQQALAAGGLDQDQINRLDTEMKDRELRREIRELLADYFARHLYFPSDPQSHVQAGIATLEEFYKGGNNAYLSSVKTDFGIRSLGVDLLCSNHTVGDVALKEFDENLEVRLLTIQKEGASKVNVSRSKERGRLIRKAVIALDLLSYLPEVDAMLKGFANCGIAKVFHGEEPGHSLLSDMRDFMAKDTPVSLEDNFAFLDHLWFKHLHNRERKHLM